MLKNPRLWYIIIIHFVQLMHLILFPTNNHYLNILLHVFFPGKVGGGEGGGKDIT